jgi:hypothetical protein
MKYRNYSLDTTRNDVIKYKRLEAIIRTETGIDISKGSRKREIVALRKIYYKILSISTKMTYTSIGKTVGKQHCTVLHALTSFDWDYNTDPPFKELYDKIYYIFSEGKPAETTEGLIRENLILQETNRKLLETINKLKKQTDQEAKQKISNTIRPRNQQTKIYTSSMVDII